jgi:hypothetical protein
MTSPSVYHAPARDPRWTLCGRGGKQIAPGVLVDMQPPRTRLTESNPHLVTCKRCLKMRMSTCKT